MAIEPITREEKLMAKASGEDLPEIKPITRREMFLAKAGGQDIEVPTPITREEMFLQKIAENGGGSGGGDLDALIDGSLTEITSNAERVKDNAFYNNNDITHVNFPNALSIGNYAFYNTLVYGGVFTGNFPKVTDIKSYAFASSTTGADVHVLKEAFFPEVTKMDDYVFYKNTKLERIYFPKLKTISYYAFGTNQGQMILKSADFPEVTLIKSAAFAGCGWLTKLILRSETMCTLESTYAFNSCFHFHGTVNANSNPDGLKDGYIYVPRALIDSYKTATNWVTFADQFRALEDYTVDGTTTGELDESKVSL